jgi:hypothetical protein
MLNKIRILIGENEKLYRLFNLIVKLFYYPIQNYFYKKKILKRKKLSIFNYEALSKNMSSPYIAGHDCENNFYGHNLLLKKALKNKMPKKYYMEHGLFFGKYASRYSYFKDIHVIITYSKKRIEHIIEFLNKRNIKLNKKCITLGPFILYSDGLMSSLEKEKIKKKYGKILLVFPTHSLPGVNVKTDVSEFMKEIDKISKFYDTVFICMYWKDILNKKHLEYKNKSYVLVTAGHVHDSNFLNRLKDIIELSDMTMSNNAGSHVGYCVVLNKPHYVFSQEITFYGENVNHEFRIMDDDLDYKSSIQNEENEVKQVFSKYSAKISKKQKKLVEKYWGKKEIKEYTFQ